MVTEFDKGARGNSPYCRCVLLPLGIIYGLIERTSTLSGKAIMLVRIPPGSLPFMHQEGYFLIPHIRSITGSKNLVY